MSAGALQSIGARLFPTLALIPGVNLLSGFVPGDSISLLNCAFELFARAGDLGKVFIRTSSV